MLSDRSRTSDVNPFRFRNLQPRSEFSISIGLRARLQFPRSDTENVHHETTRFNACMLQFHEVRVVTFAQRWGNDSL
jgi:hypothetical protein